MFSKQSISSRHRKLTMNDADRHSDAIAWPGSVNDDAARWCGLFFRWSGVADSYVAEIDESQFHPVRQQRRSEDESSCGTAARGDVAARPVG